MQTTPSLNHWRLFKQSCVKIRSIAIQERLKDQLHVAERNAPKARVHKQRRLTGPCRCRGNENGDVVLSMNYDEDGSEEEVR